MKSIADQVEELMDASDYLPVEDRDFVERASRLIALGFPLTELVKTEIAVLYARYIA